MRGINKENIILENEVFDRNYIERRMGEGGFNSISKFELFIWDLEMLLQLQKKLGDKIILKGGAAAQFYIPVAYQRTSVDIDMICLATSGELHEALSEIEQEFNGEMDYCKFIAHRPKNPKLELGALETYYCKVPSICDTKELNAPRGEQQEIKVEILFSDRTFPVTQIERPELFALETRHVFKVLALEALFADKLTTLGPNTIGITEDRADEQFKQIYDLVTLFVSNAEQVLSNKDKIREHYRDAAITECMIRNIPYDHEQLLRDMRLMVDRIKDIENSKAIQKFSNDFQSLYLRKTVNRDKALWAIAGYQLGLLIEHIFGDCTKILHYREIEEITNKLQFDNIRGPERGRLNNEVRSALETAFGAIPELSKDLMKKRLSRIVWELASIVPLDEIRSTLRKAVADN